MRARQQAAQAAAAAEVADLEVYLFSSNFAAAEGLELQLSRDAGVRLQHVLWHQLLAPDLATSHQRLPNRLPASGTSTGFGCSGETNGHLCCWFLEIGFQQC